MADLNYFICTLGQAVKVNQENPHRFATINEFIDHQAHTIPDRLAVGFPVPNDHVGDRNWGSNIFSTQPEISQEIVRLIALQLSEKFVHVPYLLLKDIMAFSTLSVATHGVMAVPKRSHCSVQAP